jgi:zinc transporter
MNSSDGLISAYLLNGRGGGRQIGWDEVRSWKAERGFLWVHLNRTAPDARQWLKTEANLDPLVCEALLAKETRPRSQLADDAMFVILRGVNLNPGAEPEDMVSLRLWVEALRVITLRASHLMAIEDVRSTIGRNVGPKTGGEFLAAVAGRLIDRMAPIIDSLDDEIDDLEEQILETQNQKVRGKLASLRRRVITLRRYIAPQRDVMTRLSTERMGCVSDIDRLCLREVADRLTRYVEDLDAARERAAVTQEELTSRTAAQMNRTMYVLSLVAAVFLPLGLITGLLGINVGGIPGEKSPLAFIIVTLILVGLAGVMIWTFRRMRWF